MTGKIHSRSGRMTSLRKANFNRDLNSNSLTTQEKLDLAQKKILNENQKRVDLAERIKEIEEEIDDLVD